MRISDSRPGLRLSLLGPVLVAMALALAGPIQAETAVETYTVQHRDARDLEQLAAAVLGENGSVTVEPGTNSLILTGEPAALGRSLEALRSRDLPLRTVVLHYRAGSLTDARALGLRPDWRGSQGELLVGPLREDQDTNHSAISSLWKRRHRDFSGTLRVLEGKPARIATGRVLPMQSFFMARRGVLASHSDAVLIARSGIEARPTLLGSGKVQLEIRPFLARAAPAPLTPGRASETSFVSSETTVIVAPGETLVIGAASDELAAGENTPYAARAEQAPDGTVVLLLRVEVE